MKTPPSEVDTARQRLELLYADTGDGGPRDPHIRRLSPTEAETFKAEHAALRTVLDELHRLNLAVSIQRGIIERSKLARKSRNRKAAAEGKGATRK
jgi:hypothetical protein